MASNPPGQCCTHGYILEGEPSGELIKIADGKTDAYLAVPPSTKVNALEKDVAILYLPDVFGIYPNSKLMADSFAAQGYTTLVVDLFNGDPLALEGRSADFDFMGWIQKGTGGNNPHTPQAIDPVVVCGIETLWSRGFKKIGAVGYCFGAKYVVRHYKSGINVGYVAHPSFVDEAELAAITGPLAISAAGTDSIFPVIKRHESENILREIKQPHQIHLFSEVEHGFAVRSDPKVKAARFAQEGAFKQAISWFEEHLDYE